MEQMEVEKDESQEQGAIQTQLEESLKGLNIEDGQIVDGTVIQVADGYVFIDIGYRTEGRIPVQEFGSTRLRTGTVFFMHRTGTGNRLFLSNPKRYATLCPLYKGSERNE